MHFTPPKDYRSVTTDGNLRGTWNLRLYCNDPYLSVQRGLHNSTRYEYHYNALLYRDGQRRSTVETLTEPKRHWRSRGGTDSWGRQRFW